MCCLQATLDIEYTPLLGPPEERSSVPHDDWVSCVTSVGATRKSGGGAASGDYIVSGSYDGSLHVFHKATGALKSTSSVVAHPGGTTAVSAGGKHVFSGGKDGAVRMWTATEGQLSSKAVFHGHTDAVQSVCPAPDGSLVCSGAWDCSVRVWAAGDSALKAAAAEAEARTDAAGPRKRRTGGGVEVAVHETVVEFSAHTQVGLLVLADSLHQPCSLSSPQER